MRDDIKISVIVPVYNVSKYLKRCLDSIIGQTLKEIEIIVINDCSPDPLDDAIGREYEKLDSRVQYIKHEKNKGLGGARNTGILQAKGVFLGFVDSDDCIHKDMYKVMYEQAIKNDCDVVQCGFNRVSEDYIVPDHAVSIEGKIGIIEDRDKKIHTYFVKGEFINGIACSKLVSRKLHLDKDILFPEGRLHEDFPYIFYVLFHSKKIVLLPEVYYYYCQRAGSIIYSSSSKRIFDMVQSLAEMREFLRGKKYHESYKNVYWDLYAGIFTSILNLAKPIKKMNEVKKILKKDDFCRSNLKFRIRVRLFILLHRLNAFDLVLKIYYKFFKRKSKDDI